MRVARNGYKYNVSAGIKENNMPIAIQTGYHGEKKFLPTVAFALDLNLADDLFKNASRVIGKIDVTTKEAVTLGALLVPAINEAIEKVKKQQKKKSK